MTFFQYLNLWILTWELGANQFRVIVLTAIHNDDDDDDVYDDNDDEQ
jgi:hypothetical protein